ncbi:uncharacterized protein LOC129613080 [Condylostylus longicornis]|uniref:uncharacterized protein LOC129613080 n=1 Tax=Condylostylus longicornis TaxID=2530218 RepID=UPI00244DCF7F|nr:uncharacterized protein LOC129613080 [Condylostylus longicornis]
MSQKLGRSISTLVEFFKQNSIRIPIGPMVLNVKRSDDDSDYMEINLLGKNIMNQTTQDKGVGRRHKVINRRGKKHLQIIIPMYLAANSFGWTLLAIKAVTLLAIKAVLVSKLAFLVASSIVIKNFMDNSHKYALALATLKQ